MPVGADGFVAERLIEAREARGKMTKSSLADVAEVSVETISKIEKKESSPRQSLITRFALVLNVKESFFFRPVNHTEPNPIFWRSKQAATKGSRIVAARKFGWTKEISDEYLKSYLEMPKLMIPNQRELGVPFDPASLTDSEIENIAQRCREFWDLGKMPIPNLMVLLENNGLLVTHGKLESDKLDAFSNISEFDCSYHMFIGTDGVSAVRCRLDAAHELAHLILHSHLPRSYFSDLDNKKHKLIEHQAFRFASAFLMPADSFAGDVWLTALEALLSLKERWKVSVAAMIMRCEALGIIDETHSKRLWITYSRRWKKTEPLDDKIPIEKPQLMKRCFDLLLDSKIKTKTEILYDLPYSQNDIETLMNLPEGYLSDNFGEVKPFLPSLKPVAVSQSQDGKVISIDSRKRET